jgi:hypothetical protein
LNRFDPDTLFFGYITPTSSITRKAVFYTQEPKGNIKVYAGDKFKIGAITYAQDRMIIDIQLLPGHKSGIIRDKLVLEIGSEHAHYELPLAANVE